MADHLSPHSPESLDPDASNDSEGAKNPFLSIRTLLWRFFGAIVLGGVGASLLWEGIHLTTGIGELSPGVSSLIMLLGIQGGMAVFAWKTLQHARVNIGQMMGLFPPRYNWWWGVGWAIALLTFTFSFMATLAYGAVALFPNTISEILTTLFTTLVQESNPFWVDACMAAIGSIIAPLVEEFTFRGLFLHCWSARRSIQTGLVLTAILFASLHPQNFVGMFVFSLVLSLLYLRTRSLWVPVGVHAIYNGIIFGSNLLSTAVDNSPTTSGLDSPEALAEATVNQTIAYISEARFGIASGVFLLIAGFFVLRFMHKNWPQPSALLPYFQNSPELP